MSTCKLARNVSNELLVAYSRAMASLSGATMHHVGEAKKGEDGNPLRGVPTYDMATGCSSMTTHCRHPLFS